jgi:hypothetical protein
MRMSPRLLVVVTLSWLISTSSSAAQQDLARSPRILSARTVYFENQTGSVAVGNNALARLKKWGKFQIVSDREHADLVFLLSADSYTGGKIIMAGGQTGTIDSRGHVEEDPIPNYARQTRTRYAYLTVIDATNGGKLWSEEHLWGGLLTGFNSVGSRLVKDLEKQTKK